jgi:uncharacterized protein (DUF1501 family)
MQSKYLTELQSRRRFLRQATCAAVGTIGMSTVLRDMRLINSAIAQSNVSSDYKALICVFLNGGNDSNNMIIPTTPSEWQSYAATRTAALAIPNTDGTGATALSLLGPGGTVANPYKDADGHTYGFHPAMPELQSLFNAGQCAVLLNVGSLSYPITKAQYQSGAVPQPPQLYSHSDQQTQWQTSIPDQPPTSGWGGRICDLLNANANPSGQISMAVTLAGSNIFEVGSANAAPQYSVNTTSGAVSLNSLTSPSGTGLSLARYQAMQQILTGSTSTSGTGGEVGMADLQMSAYANALNQAIYESGLLSTVLTNNVPSNMSYLQYFGTGTNINKVQTPNGGTNFSSSLMAQMQMVLRLIDAGKNFLNMKRQVFFIQVGGYDTHTVQTQSTATGIFSNANVIIGAQANLLAELSQTLGAFSQALTAMGVLRGDTSMQNRVTAFTVSDFSRTFPSNGSGSDHGWGGHHLVVGGAVNGGATYGHLPILQVNGPSDTGTGRWIPTTAVDQYAATLASWFGVDSSNLSTIFPNLRRFPSSNLGFI